MREPLKKTLLSEASSDLAQLLEKREAELADARARIRQLESALDARAAETAALRRIGEAMGHAAVDTSEMLRLVADVGVEVTKTESALIYLFNDTRDELILRAVTDPDLQDAIGRVKVRIGEGITGGVAASKAIRRFVQRGLPGRPVPFFSRTARGPVSVAALRAAHLARRGDRRYQRPNRARRTSIPKPRSSFVRYRLAGRGPRSKRRDGALGLRKRHPPFDRRRGQPHYHRQPVLEEILQLAVAATAQTMNFKIVALLLLDEKKNELVPQGDADPEPRIRQKAEPAAR
jgi:hypothetical protein